MDLIPQRLLSHARTRPAAPAYFTRVSGRWQSTSWSVFVDECRAAARALMALGFPAGGKIAILGYNKPEWVIAYHAAMLAGGAAAGVYTTSSPDDVAHIVLHSEAALVVVETRAQYEKVPASTKTIVTMRGAETIDDPRVLPWKQFLAKGALTTDTDLDARIAALAAGDVATLIYTSGTTGPPKGVMLSHASLAWSARVFVDLGKGTDRDTGLSYLPLSHIAEQMATIHLPTTIGAPVYYCESIDKVRANVPEVRPTVFFGVPRVWEKFHAALVGRFAALPAVRQQLVAWTRGVCTQVNAHRMRGESPSLALSARNTPSRSAWC
ncbi:MAG: AMP-binding protein [Deltaproteobacteria bacterium]|nr:AMP-binding protein [Deltaproteobacteria bacterium]